MNQYVTVNDIRHIIELTFPFFAFTFFVCIFVCFIAFIRFLDFTIDFYHDYKSCYYSKSQRELRRKRVIENLQKQGRIF